MVVLFSSKSVDPAPWRAALTRQFPGLDFRVYPEMGNPAEIQVSLAWRLPPGTFPQLTGLKLIYCTGAGVDQLLVDPELPADVPICRIVDDGQATDMAVYCLHAVFDHHRFMPTFRAAQTRAEWVQPGHRSASDTRVGVMGLGALGVVVARRLADCGFQVAGWTRGPRAEPGIETFTGADALPAFLARAEILVNLLPLTPETEDLMDARLFAQLPKGAAVVNAGRGRHLVDADLIAALDSGHLSGATLDVFRTEPLPADHPFWRHPKIVVTPHVASLAHADSVIAQIAENLRRLQAGEPLLHRIDRARGY